MKKFSKNDIITTLKNSDMGTDSNFSKNVKANQFLLNNINLLSEKRNYNEIINSSGCVNRGILAEIMIKELYNSYKKQFSVKGKCDMVVNNKHYEIKSILNPSSLPRVNTKDIEKIDKYIVLTYKGVFEIEPNDIVKNINNLNYFRKDGHKMRECFVEKFGTLNKEITSKLVL